MSTMPPNKNRAPGPKGGFIWGSLSDFTENSIGFMSDCVREHGDVVRFRFGPVTAHLVNRPEYVEHVLSRNAKNYDKHTRSAERIRATCGDSLLYEGPSWQRHRRLIQPVFQPTNMADLEPVIDSCMDEMLERWSAHAQNNQPIDIVAEMMELLITASVKILFSTDVDASRIDRALETILADTWRRLEALVDPSMISKRFHRKPFKAAVAEIDEIFFDIIRERKKQGDTSDLLSRLLVAHEAEADVRLNDQELRDAAVTLLLAGHETTANALARAFYLVGGNPETLETCDTRNLFSEAIRLYPSIWIIERHALCDDKIGGYHIPKGSSVLISPYLLHRHSEFWDAADTFDPTRFEPAVSDMRPRHAYIPFGLGAHRCVGLHMANTLAARIMENVFEQFRLQPLPDQAETMIQGITLRHAAPVWMQVKKR